MDDRWSGEKDLDGMDGGGDLPVLVDRLVVGETAQGGGFCGLSTK